MSEGGDARARFVRAEEIFRAAVGLDPAARRRLIEARCAGDEALRSEVESLIEAELDLPTCFEEAALAGGAQRRAAEALDAPEEAGTAGRPAPERIGPYRIVEVLGAGGMGIVYRARQEEPRREVAVKVIRTAAMSAALQRRFRLEARALARLDHPGIARILEVGIDESGAGPQPFIAMEYVAGRTLADWAEAKARSTPERLRLIAEICDALEHAHQKGVIHRDLKPANVIVDADDRPHVVDFGVARIAGTDDAASTLATDPGQLVGTLQYMSPEQIEASPDDLDTRSDVYAIGVVAYEILAGRLPWDLEGHSVFEIVRIVRDTEPARLGTLDRHLRGDVDVIVARAMERVRERRYQSARDVAEDIRHHLEGRPINARRDSAVYVIGKQMRRHRVPITVAALVLALLLYVVVSTTISRVRAWTTGGALAVLDSLDVTADPFDQERPDLGQLEAAAAWIDRELEGDPRQAARLHRPIGLGYLKHARFSDAQHHFAEALRLRRRLHAPPHPRLAEAEHDQARVLYFLRAYEASETLYRSALAMRRELRGAVPAGDRAGADELDAAIADSLNDLAACRRRRGHLREARGLYEEAMAIRERLGLERWVAASLNNLGTCLADLHEWEASRACFGEALDRIAPLGINPIFVSRAQRNLAGCLARLGRHDEALAAAETALRLASAGETSRHRDVLRCRLVRAACRYRAGSLAAAQREITALLEDLEPQDGAWAGDLAQARALAGRVALAREDPRSAAPLLAAALATQATDAPRHPDTIELRRDYGACLVRLGRHADAEEVLRPAIGECRAETNVPRDLAVSVLREAIALYSAWGRAEEAGPYRDRLEAWTGGSSPAVPD